VSTGYEPGAELNSTPTISLCYCLSSAPVPVDRADIYSFSCYHFSSACLHWTESTPSSSASLVLSTSAFLLFVNLCPLYCLATLTSTMSTTATKLNERNYRQWAIEAKALLRAQGLWKYISGEMRVPRPPIVATSDSSAPTPTARDPRDTDYDFLPESTDMSYLNQFYHFLCDWERWQMYNDMACG
jgi:hypothetical protein